MADGSSSEDSDVADYLMPHPWSALALRDGSGIDPRPKAEPLAQPLPFGEGHSLHSGPPFLRSTYGWGHVLCHACQPEVLESSIADAIAAHRAEVWVQWSDARGDVAARPVDAVDGRAHRVDHGVRVVPAEEERAAAEAAARSEARAASAERERFKL